MEGKGLNNNEGEKPRNEGKEMHTSIGKIKRSRRKARNSGDQIVVTA